MRFFRCALFISVSLLGTLACSKQPPALTTPSGEQPSYAEQYPSRLGSLRTRFAADEAKVRAALPELTKSAEKLDHADPNALEQLFELADREGRSSAYAEQAEDSATVARFWDEERQPLHQKIGGAVSYAGKQKQCSKECGDDLGGVAAGASDRAVEKQLEERQQRLGEIHRFIEDHEDELGKANTDAAEKQASAIAELSYIAHVRLELYRRELEAALNDSSEVRATLDRIQKESAAVVADPQASKNKKALAEKRRASAAEARTTLDIQEQQGKQALGEMQKREQQLQADYEAAFDRLKETLKAKAQK